MTTTDESAHSVDFDGPMRHLMVIGSAGLTAWTIVSATGLLLGVLRISPHGTFRFLLAVLVLVARRAYWEVQEWRWRHMPPDERYGFASPIWEHPRASELDTVTDGRQGVEGPRR
jgi:hypothetical protein